MTKAEEKQALRSSIRALEKTLSADYKAESSAAIARHLLALPEYRAAGTVFCFVGTAREIDTTAIHLVEAEAAYEQMDLFGGSAASRQRSEQLEAAMDRIRGKYGTGAITYGAAAPEKEEDPLP